MADYRVGQVLEPDTPLAVAVAASAAFPPFLSPLTLKLAPGSVVGFKTDPSPALHHPPYTERAVLTDGGVYDNLGLQAASASSLVLVSDGGGRLENERHPRRLWPLQLLRVLHVMNSQVRALRSHQLISDFQAGRRRGRFWGIYTLIERYGVPDALPAPPERTLKLAATPTRLARLPMRRRQRLVNWGYAVSDAAMRSDGLASSPPAPPPAFPFTIGI
jgi:NTE family protein